MIYFCNLFFVLYIFPTHYLIQHNRLICAQIFPYPHKPHFLLFWTTFILTLPQTPPTLKNLSGTILVTLVTILKIIHHQPHQLFTSKCKNQGCKLILAALIFRCFYALPDAFSRFFGVSVFPVMLISLLFSVSVGEEVIRRLPYSLLTFSSARQTQHLPAQSQSFLPTQRLPSRSRYAFTRLTVAALLFRPVTNFIP